MDILILKEYNNERMINIISSLNRCNGHVYVRILWHYNNILSCYSNYNIKKDLKTVLYIFQDNITINAFPTYLLYINQVGLCVCSYLPKYLIYISLGNKRNNYTPCKYLVYFEGNGRCDKNVMYISIGMWEYLTVPQYVVFIKIVDVKTIEPFFEKMIYCEAVYQYVFYSYTILKTMFYQYTQ